MTFFFFLVFDRVENIVGKGENAGIQHFLFFSHCFQKYLYVKVVDGFWKQSDKRRNWSFTFVVDKNRIRVA